MKDIDKLAEKIAFTLELLIKKGKLTQEQADAITERLDKPEFLGAFLKFHGDSL